MIKAHLLAGVATAALLIASGATAGTHWDTNSYVYGPEYRSYSYIYQYSDNTPLFETYFSSSNQPSDGTQATTFTGGLNFDFNNSNTSGNVIETDVGFYTGTSTQVYDNYYNYYNYDYGSADAWLEIGDAWDYDNINTSATFTGLGSATLVEAGGGIAGAYVDLNKSISGSVAGHAVIGWASGTQTAELTASTEARASAQTWRRDYNYDYYNYYDNYNYDYVSSYSNSQAGFDNDYYDHTGLDLQAEGNAKVAGVKISVAGSFSTTELPLTHYNNNYGYDESIVNSVNTESNMNTFTISGALDLGLGRAEGDTRSSVGMYTYARTNTSNYYHFDNDDYNYNYNYTYFSSHGNATAGEYYWNSDKKELNVVATGKGKAEAIKGSITFGTSKGTRNETKTLAVAIDGVAARAVGSEGSSITGKTVAKTNTYVYNQDYHNDYYTTDYYWHTTNDSTATADFDVSSKIGVPSEIAAISTSVSYSEGTQDENTQKVGGKAKNIVRAKGSDVKLESKTGVSNYTYDQQCTYYSCSGQESERKGAETYSKIDATTGGYGLVAVTHEESSSSTLSRNDRGNNGDAHISTSVVGLGTPHQVSPGVYVSTVNVHVHHNARVGNVTVNSGGQGD